MVRQSRDSRLHPAAGFPNPGWDFNVTGFADANHLRAHPQRIAYVFQRVRADHKIELLIREWVRSLVTDVALNPSLAA